MMNLVSRTPSIVSSSTSVSLGLRKTGSLEVVVAEDRSGQPDRFSSTDYSKLDYDRAWSSQGWKSEVMTHGRSGQPDKASWSDTTSSSSSRNNPSRRNRAIRKVRRATS